MPKINNDMVEGLHGAVGKNLVYKTRKDGKTFVSKYPDMSNVVASKNQIQNRYIFSEAVKFATDLKNDPVRAAAFKLKEGETLYLAAIRQYMQLHLNTNSKNLKFAEQYNKKKLEELNLTARQVKTALFVLKTGIITNGDCQKLHSISKATATRDLQELVRLKVLESTGIKGSGASYREGSWLAHEFR